MKNDIIEIYDEDNRKKTFLKLAELGCESDDKTYVLFMDPDEKDENINKIYSGILENDRLLPIDDPEIQDELNQYIKDLENDILNNKYKYPPV